MDTSLVATCSKCGEANPLRKGRKTCLPCHAAAQSARYHGDGGTRERLLEHLRQKSADMRAFVDSVRATGCVDCGEMDTDVLEFDHVPERGAKLFTISDVKRIAGWARLFEEIAKCDVVCANCHRRRTKARLVGNGATNGTEAKRGAINDRQHRRQKDRIAKVWTEWKS